MSEETEYAMIAPLPDVASTEKSPGTVSAGRVASADPVSPIAASAAIAKERRMTPFIEVVSARSYG